MSRFPEADEYDPFAQGRWEANVERSIKGRKGQQALRDLRDALLAMPEKRLIRDEFATPDGEVCAIGAAVAYKRAQAKGIPITEAAKELAQEDPDSWDGYTKNPETGRYEKQVESIRYDRATNSMVPTGEWFTEERYHDDDPADYTATRGSNEAGFSYTLAWDIGWQNDETWSHLTPEQRWRRCLKWVESRLDKATA